MGEVLLTLIVLALISHNAYQQRRHEAERRALTAAALRRIDTKAAAAVQETPAAPVRPPRRDPETGEEIPTMPLIR